MSTLTFYVAGTPAPQGSKRAFIIGGKARLVEMSKRVKPWRRAVYDCAREAMILARIVSFRGPVRVSLEFVMPRPKRPTKPGCDVRPDIDKLARATLDGLTGMIFDDDSAVVRLAASKRYARASGIEEPGCLISIAKAEQHSAGDDAA